jgi:UDP-glucose 4-epimerase
MKILVTGGTGYIGSHTIIDLIENGFEVVSIDNGLNSEESILDNVEKITNVKVKNYKENLCSEAIVNQIFSQENFDGVIHFAALKSVGDSMQQPIEYFKNNLNSLLNTIEASRQNNVKAFIFSSSCTVYGDVKISPVNEQTPLQNAASVYGRTKQMGEQIISDSAATTNMKSILLRYFNPAGAHPSGIIGEAPRNIAQNLIPVITETAIGKRDKVNVYGNDYNTRDGSCIRDYIHIMDLARAHTLAIKYILEEKQQNRVEVFNLGIGKGVTVLEAIRAFERVSGVKLNYELAPRREGDVEAIYSDYSKANKELGWSPKFTIDDIMESAWLWEQNRVKL